MFGCVFTVVVLLTGGLVLPEVCWGGLLLCAAPFISAFLLVELGEGFEFVDITF